MRDPDSALERSGFEPSVPPAICAHSGGLPHGSSLTLRWRKTDSNSRSLREGTGYGEPLQGSIAVSNLNLKVALPFVPPPPIGNVQKSLSQERDRWFESGSLQRRVVRTPVPTSKAGLSVRVRWAASEYGRRRNRAAIRACKGKSDGVIPDHCERHDRSQFSGR